MASTKWMRTCRDGPHKERGEPCGCPDLGYTCCLACPLRICVIDAAGTPRSRRRSIERGRSALELLAAGHTSTDVTVILGIDYTQLRRALQAVGATKE